MSTEAIRDAVDSIPLVDHHVHGAFRRGPSRTQFELMLTESDRPGPPGTSMFDSQVGYAVRRWCAPMLGLPSHAAAEEYLAKRDALSNEQVSRTFLAGSGIAHYLLETGFRGDLVHDVSGMRDLSGARVDEVVRLETVAEELAMSGVSAETFPDRFVDLLAERTRRAAGLKSIIAYRFGLDFEPERPSRRDVVNEAGRWLSEVGRSGAARLTSPVILRFLIWAGLDRALPLQFHVGYGDPDLDLARCDPLKMATFLSRVSDLRVPCMLLHTYPFHRTAGYLAQMFPHVYMDVGLGINYTGARSPAVIAESLELAPFSKVLFSSDAWGLPELHFLGAQLWRVGMAGVLGEFVELGEWSMGDAAAAARLMGAENAERVYDLGRES